MRVSVAPVSCLRALLLGAVLVVAPAALAQDDAGDAPVEGAGIDVGDTVFARAATPSTRFPDADTAGPKFSKDDRLVVLVVEGDRLRVMTPDNAFGWIAADAVTTEEPAPDLDALLQQLGSQGMGGGGGMGGF